MLGCTEPIPPRRLIAACSSNIIKNMKSTTGDLRGIETSVGAGHVLEVLSCVQPEDVEQTILRVDYIGRDGVRETDEKILNIMPEQIG